jgi:divalent metal cation (Fe/Co/Zn/Cd) transporter
LTSAAWLDPVGGLAISGMIVQAGWGNTKSAMLELADVAMDEEVKENVEKAAATALQAQSSGEADIRGVQGIKSGQNFLVDIEVGAPSHYTVGQLDAIKSALRQQISADVKGIRRVTVRFTAEKEGVPFADEFIAGKEENLDEHGHEHDHDHDHSHAEGHSSSTQVNGNANKRK